MHLKTNFTCFFTFILMATIANSQTSEILKLDEINAYRYKSYYKDGSIKSIVGFYAKKPYSSVESFEENLEDYKVKYHGERKEYYQSGQLKEIVVYDKGKVIEFAKLYFEDGEEYAVPTDEIPEFQFDIQEQNIWFSKKILEIESKYKVSLEGNGVISLEIGKAGTIKSVKVKAPIESQEKYLLEIANQIEVIKPGKKNGQDIGTRFSFRIEL